MQSQDSENAQRNLEIAQILRLRGTYTYLCSGAREPKNEAIRLTSADMTWSHSGAGNSGDNGSSSLIGVRLSSGTGEAGHKRRLLC